MRALLVFSMVACRLSEREQHRRRQPRFEPLVAYLFLAMGNGLAWCCRRWTWRTEVLRDTLFQVRRELLGRILPSQVPLVVLSILLEHPAGTIVHTKCVNFHYLYLLTSDRVQFLVSSTWAKFPIDFLWHRVIRLAADPWSRTDRATWLGNTQTEVDYAVRQHNRGALVNTNCFINEDRVPLLTFSDNPPYDAVLNSNAGRWKRHELAEGVPALAYITYSTTPDGKMWWPVSTFEPAFINQEYLNEAGRGAIFADSCCGLILSACEGQNNSTVEFLLSGLPIVSTPSLGGRDIWFSEMNSIVCDATVPGVSHAVATWRERVKAGTLDRLSLRAECIERIGESRLRFVTELQRLLDELGISLSARSIFDEHRRKDLLLHSLSFQLTDSPHRHPYCNGKAWYHLMDLPF